MKRTRREFGAVTAPMILGGALVARTSAALSEANTEKKAMKIAWITDPHLNFADDEDVDRFMQDIREVEPDAVLVGGDIGEADTFIAYLRQMAATVDLPIHFVLGNHDYYRGSIAGVRRAARALSRRSPQLNWLAESEPIMVGDDTALIGHGGWGDARAAGFMKSDVVLNDYLLIDELRETNDTSASLRQNIVNPELMAQLQRLGDEAADHFRKVLPESLDRCDHVIVLMHVPPFREACWHNGKPSDDNWAPHFTCIAAGEVLLEFAKHCPNKRITVLCGHTHSPGSVKIRENLEVWTGGAEYGTPQVQRVLDVD